MSPADPLSKVVLKLRPDLAGGEGQEDMDSKDLIEEIVLDHALGICPEGSSDLNSQEFLAEIGKLPKEHHYLIEDYKNIHRKVELMRNTIGKVERIAAGKEPEPAWLKKGTDQALEEMFGSKSEEAIPEEKEDPPNFEIRPVTVPYRDLYLDPNKPHLAQNFPGEERIPDEEIEGRQEELMALFPDPAKRSDLTDLENSIRQVGLVGGQPIIVRELPNQKYVLMDGNRRIAALKLIMSEPRRASNILKEWDELVPVMVVKGDWELVEQSINSSAFPLTEADRQDMEKWKTGGMKTRPKRQQYDEVLSRLSSQVEQASAATDDLAIAAGVTAVAGGVQAARGSSADEIIFIKPDDEASLNLLQSGQAAFPDIDFSPETPTLEDSKRLQMSIRGMQNLMSGSSEGIKPVLEKTREIVNEMKGSSNSIFEQTDRIARIIQDSINSYQRKGGQSNRSLLEDIFHKIQLWGGITGRNIYVMGGGFSQNFEIAKYEATVHAILKGIKSGTDASNLSEELIIDDLRIRQFGIAFASKHYSFWSHGLLPIFDDQMSKGVYGKTPPKKEEYPGYVELVETAAGKKGVPTRSFERHLFNFFQSDDGQDNWIKIRVPD